MESSKRKKLSDSYQHGSFESSLYKKWREKELFKPSNDKEKEPFSVVLPPPNVTGILHLGHALNLTIQDALIRRKRMQGYASLWVPGTDHAGIATQAKVEEKLRKTGITRHDLGREKFLEEVWKWKEEYAKNIHQQWEKMGISVDYSRERFTLDKDLSESVRKVFVSLYKKGLIYKGKRMINWDTVYQTALSDIETEKQEIEQNLIYLKYQIKGEEGFIPVATTRPETIFGDVAIAVSSKSEQYASLIGKTAIVPIVGREIPIIADEIALDDKGSGAVKITPAHSKADFEAGMRHSLEAISVIDGKGCLNENTASYQGMDRFEAREKITQDLLENGYVIKIEKTTSSVEFSDRSKTPAEPLLSEQWFVRMDSLAQAAIELQRSDDGVHFVPERFEDTYLQWISDIQDWCISRQLWWGHRIPVWYCSSCEHLTVAEIDPCSCESCGSKEIKQDEDVLDTWFSSGLWAFSALGWIEDSEDYSRFYPTSVLVTAKDIIFFWVARMIFSSFEFTGKKPFSDVLIHGLVLDEKGEKMSKSKGNGIDPIKVIDEFGVDPLRLMLLTNATLGGDQRYSEEKVNASRSLITKLWNASRYVLMQIGDDFTPTAIEELQNLSDIDKWMLHRLNLATSSINEKFDKYEFSSVGSLLQSLLRDDFCDWYIELSKIALSGSDENAKKNTKNILLYTLDQILRLYHPIIPFATEEIWLSLPGRTEDDSLLTAEYPTANPLFDFPDSEGNVSPLMEAIRSVRNIRSETKFFNRTPLFIKTSDEKTEKVLLNFKEHLLSFCKADSIVISSDVQPPKDSFSKVISGAEIFLEASDSAVSSKRESLENGLQKLANEIDRCKKLLSNEKFVSKASPEVVQKEREKLQDYSNQYEKIKKQLESLDE